MATALEMINITKKFNDVIANEQINLKVDWGEIHGLIGENGAGKTTLMKILYGMYQPTDGEIYIDSQPVHFSNPKEAIQQGIGMVHQHFTLVPSLTVAENITLGKPILKNGLINIKESAKVVKELSGKFGLDVDPYKITKELPIGLQQRVEILKALYLGANLLIMDEPTAVLTPQEIERLFKTLRTLKDQGKSIIIISHKLKELLNITDNITVIRTGKITGYLETKNTTEQEISRLMMGNEELSKIDKAPQKIGQTILSLQNVAYQDKLRKIDILKNVSFEVKAGEIVGIAGVQGNGQTELIDVIAGLKEIRSGKIYLNKQQLANNTSPMKRRDLGLAHIPEDRQEIGAALDATILENFIMTDYKKWKLSNQWFINYKKAYDLAWKHTRLFDVRTENINIPADYLSGGNLQKLIIAREFFLDPSLLIAAQPTRGVDIGASNFIHQKLIEMRNEGKGVLLISNELSEIMSLSDRILVMYNGTIIGEVDPLQTTEEKIGLMMAGITEEGAGKGGI